MNKCPLNNLPKIKIYKMPKQKITHEHLVKQGFEVTGTDEYYQPKTGILVMRKTTKTGKEMFVHNGIIKKYMIELYSIYS